MIASEPFYDIYAACIAMSGAKRIPLILQAPRETTVPDQRVLRSADVLDDPVHDYLAGLRTPEQAKTEGLPVERDEQAAFVLAALLREHHRELVERGIRDVTAKKSVSAGRRTDVIAELALRPTRSIATTLATNDPERQRAERMRASYLRCSRLARRATVPWKVSGRSPEKLLEAASEELRTALKVVLR
ncbi:hypothetical protein [Streptomyces anulatus]|uniref:hypothetical protein n=1 Tax=Streptomyces anulatus TaxID=1892 RepID=UPI00368AAF0D